MNKTLSLKITLTFLFILNLSSSSLLAKDNISSSDLSGGLKSTMIGICFMNEAYHSTKNTPLFWLQRGKPAKLLLQEKELDMCWEDNTYFNLFIKIDAFKNGALKELDEEDTIADLLERLTIHNNLKNIKDDLLDLSEEKLACYMKLSSGSSCEEEILSEISDKEKDTLEIYTLSRDAYFIHINTYFSKNGINMVFELIDEEIPDITRAIRKHNNLSNLNEVKKLNDSDLKILSQELKDKFKLPSFKAIIEVAKKCFKLQENWFWRLPELIIHYTYKSLARVISTVRLIIKTIKHFNQLTRMLITKNYEHFECLVGKVMANFADLFVLLGMMI